MKHIAIICDGNRRWASANDLPVEAGYIQGLFAVERCCEWSIHNGVKYLTAYCFSTENWGRPKHQVDALKNLARWYFEERREWYIAMGICVRISGRRDHFEPDLLDILERMESDTKGGNSLVFTMCIDYGGRDEIVRAIQNGARTDEEITAMLSGDIPDPDAILRTGGERRLSNFMLWQGAYAELFFSDTLFPALDDRELDAVLGEYEHRTRNFGR